MGPGSAVGAGEVPGPGSAVGAGVMAGSELAWGEGSGVGLAVGIGVAVGVGVGGSGCSCSFSRAYRVAALGILPRVTAICRSVIWPPATLSASSGVHSHCSKFAPPAYNVLIWSPFKNIRFVYPSLPCSPSRISPSNVTP